MTSETSGRDERLGRMAIPRTDTGDGREARWLQAVLSSIHEGMLVFDPAGMVLDMNQAFTDLVGYSMADTPIVPPYPWWPTQAEDRDGFALILKRHSEARAGRMGAAEFRLFTRERRPVWVASADAIITDDDGRADRGRADLSGHHTAERVPKQACGSSPGQRRPGRRRGPRNVAQRGSARVRNTLRRA